MRAERPLRSDPVRIDAAAASVLLQSTHDTMWDYPKNINFVSHMILHMILWVIREFCFWYCLQFYEDLCSVQFQKYMYVHNLTCEKYQQTKCKYKLQCMYTTKDKYDLMLSTVIGNSAQSACAAGGKFSWWLNSTQRPPLLSAPWQVAPLLGLATRLPASQERSLHPASCLSRLIEYVNGA